MASAPNPSANNAGTAVIGRQSIPRLLVSATNKSSGKTTVSTGIIAALRETGVVVQPFKKGPDYIDPQWHTLAAGRPCYNLDFNTMDAVEISAAFCHRSQNADLSLIEANKGLYDGVDPEGTDSSAALAKLLQIPVVLVLDTTGITRGIAPLVLGYQSFDPDVNLAGVVLNKLSSARHEEKIRAALERYTDLPILGALGREAGLMVAERHLGLVTPGETEAADRVVSRLTRTMRQSLDLKSILAIAKSAPALSPPMQQSAKPTGRAKVRIGVARDNAFGFYYQDDLEALERADAELVFFSPLTSPRLPQVDGLFIGGGFPETHIAKLEANGALRAEIRKAADAGLPVYAECGGLMYLARRLRWGEVEGEMVGAIKADAIMELTPQGRGHVVLRETGLGPWPSLNRVGHEPMEIAAHEFHYARLENLPPNTQFAYQVLRGSGIDGRHDGIVLGNILAGFAHLRDTSRFRWAERFIEFVRRAPTTNL
jgi:cobyrinic acid a,c-diamide synthase